MANNSRLPTRSFFARHPLAVGFDLIGAEIASDRDGGHVAGRIVEVEAYAGADDPASHAAIYRAGKMSLAAAPGSLYMYRAYGIHTMLNIVAHEPGESGAVLIRAVEPRDGADIMRERRGLRAARLASGPGSLCQAFGLRLDDHGVDLLANDWLRLALHQHPGPVFAGPRIGISRGIDLPWRLFDPDSCAVSARRRGAAVTRETLVTRIPASESAAPDAALAPNGA